MNKIVVLTAEETARIEALKLLVEIQTYIYGEPFSLSGLQKLLGGRHGTAEVLLAKMTLLMSYDYAHLGLSNIFSLTKKGRAFSSPEFDEEQGSFHIIFGSPDPVPEQHHRRR